jgi:uncharacterized repeat protein (TIGR01451 family)
MARRINQYTDCDFKLRCDGRLQRSQQRLAAFLTTAGLALSQVTPAYAAITIQPANSTATLLNALAANGATGVSFSGTPTILGAFSSNAYGTFTTSGSNLGMTSGAVFGTGNVTQISGSPGFFWDGAGTGNTSGIERDRAALTFSFTPDAGVTKVAFRYVMGSEEYNEYVGQNFSDNITILLTGGAYSNTNVALVPNTSTGIDIDTINASLNSAYYRDNTVASPPVPDSVLDGHTTVLKTISTVVPGTTYSAEIKVADFTDNRWNTAIFVDYFGAALLLDLDGNNSSGAALANYNATFTEAGPAVAIADTDRTIINYDATNITSATIRLTNAKPFDVMTINTLPGGIAGSVNTSVPGQITVTLTGSASAAAYQTAILAIMFNNTSNVPDITARNVTVVVNDSATNSNTAVTTISMVRVPTYIYTIAKSVDKANISTPSALAYTMTLTNTGDGVMTGISVTDTLAQAAFSTSLPVSGPSGDTGTIGALDIGETWIYAATYAAGQARIDSGAVIINTVSVTSAQTSPAHQTATATTTVTQTPNMTLVKSADHSDPVPAGQEINYTYLISNTGNVTIYNVAVSDVHNGHGSFPPPGLETLQTDAAPTGDSTDAGSNGHWDALAPGDSIRFSSLYEVVQADIDLLQ